MIGSSTASAGWDLALDLSRRVIVWTAPERLYMDAVLDLADLASGTRVLDVGCGSGRLLARAADREPSALLTGVDSDHDSLALARRLSRNAPSRIDIHQCNAAELPFADGYFDVVTATLFLGALRAAPRAPALAECMRVLRPGGRIVAADWRGHSAAPAAAALHVATRMGLVARRPDWRGGSVRSELAAAGFESSRRERSECALTGTLEIVRAAAPAA